MVVRFDPDSLHECVHLYQLDGRYIGQADCMMAAGFGDTSAGREWRRQHKQRLKAAKQMAEAEIRMSAIEAADYMPDPQPDPETPLQTNVVRGAWKAPAKKVANSDVVPEAEEKCPPSGTASTTSSWARWSNGSAARYEKTPRSRRCAGRVANGPCGPSTSKQEHTRWTKT